MNVRSEGIRTSTRPPGRLATRWLAVLDKLDDRLKTRIARGRTLARGGRVRELELAPGMALGTVHDNDEQRPTLRVRTFDEAEWAKVVGVLGGRLDLLARLLEGDVADELLAALEAQGVPLLPRPKELDGDCDCGDWAVPCPHGAALHHVLGEALDGEPFLLFSLRGRPREQLLTELRRLWGDSTGVRIGPKGPSDEPVPAGDPYASPVPLPPVSFRFHTAPSEGGLQAGPATNGMVELGPLAGDDDLQRTLAPLYDAGAAYALEVALAEVADLRPRRRGAALDDTPAPFPLRDELTERIVDALADAAEGTTAAELARDLGTAPDAVERELDELGTLGIVTRSDEGKFWLG